MRRFNMRALIFMALGCDLGLFAKKLIAPAANIITDNLHIPGGIGTSFSLMFLVICALLIQRFGCAALMGAVQSAVALSLGMVGSMGALAPVCYIITGVVIDCVVYLGRRRNWDRGVTAVTANMLSAAAASLTANVIVFRLTGAPLLLYVSVALFSGAVCGLLGSCLEKRLRTVINF